MRPTKIKYYLNIARDIASRSTCTRRRFGAILVRNDTIISTGYNGSVRGATNCGESIRCLKDLHKEPSYQSYEHCPAVHAEVNTILNAAREGHSTTGATLYLNIGNSDGDKNKSDRPCRNCRREAIQAGIYDCYYVDNKGKVQHEFISDWVVLENNFMVDQTMVADMVK